MHIKAFALVALAAVSSAENLRFAHISPLLSGLSRRDDGSAYSPEETECGDGATCAEACGSGFEECKSSAGVSSCYNPEAGETCCSGLGLGTSCQAGYFCAHDNDKSTVCCAEGTSLEDCASLNGADALESDAAQSASESSGDKSTAASTGSSGAKATASEAEVDKPEGADEDSDSGARHLVPGVALFAGVAACLL